MAGSKRAGAPGAAMSRGEIIGGCVYLPLYVYGLAWLLTWAIRALALPATAAEVNIVYFLINFLAVVLIFHRWLIASLSAVSRQLGNFVQALVLGFVFYYALSWVVSLALDLLNLSVASPNDAYVAALAGGSFRWMLVCTVLLAPLTEETLFRGLMFGNLRRKSRAAAYVVSMLAFAAVHVWQYVGELGWGPALLCLVEYLPAGAALNWTYEKAGTIWASVLVHCAVNAVSMGVLHG